MKQNFTYTKFNEDTADTLVLSFGKLVEMSIAKKNETAEYKEANKNFSEALAEYCVEGTGMTFTGLEMIKNPMVHTNPFYTTRFSNVLAQAITPAVPTVAASGYDVLYDVTQVGYGEAATYTVDSNELFIVNDLAEGVARGGVQTIYNNEYSVKATRKQISTFVDWYHVVSGKQDWGKFGQKIGDSFVAYIQATVLKAMTSIIDVDGKAATLGIAGYVANDFDDTNWVTLARDVQLANGNSEIYALGTKIALGVVLPADANGFRYNPKDDIVTVGYLPSYKGVTLVELGNALVPGTLNTATPTALIADDFIYIIAMGSYKPCKVVIEGSNVSVSQDPLQSADHTFGMTIDMRIGTDVIVGSKFGIMKLV